jgi:hypothetical protein
MILTSNVMMMICTKIHNFHFSMFFGQQNEYPACSFLLPKEREIFIQLPIFVYLFTQLHFYMLNKITIIHYMICPLNEIKSNKSSFWQASQFFCHKKKFFIMDLFFHERITQSVSFFTLRRRKFDTYWKLRWGGKVVRWRNGKFLSVNVFVFLIFIVILLISLS